MIINGKWANGYVLLKSMKATNTEARDESVAVVSVDSGMNTSEIAADPLAATKCAGTNTDHVSMCDIDMNTSVVEDVRDAQIISLQADIDKVTAG